MPRAGANAILGFALALLLNHGAHAAAAKITFSAASPGLNFGSFVVLSTCSNCTVTISPAGVRSASAGILLMNTATGTAAAFSATGTSCGSCTYAVTTPAPSPVSILSGGVTMTVNSYTFSQTSAAAPNILHVGATLTIPSSGATPGTFTSTSSYTVTTNP